MCLSVRAKRQEFHGSLGKREVYSACRKMVIYFPPFLFFRGYQLGLAGEREDIKKETEQNNQGFFWHQKQYISHFHCCVLASLPLFPLFICLFLSLLFIYSSLALWRCRCRSTAPGRCVQYRVSIEPFLMNLLRKLKYCRMGRCGSLNLMHGDR